MQRIFMLNRVAEFVWERLGGEATLAEIRDGVLERFEADPRDVRQDMVELCGKALRPGPDSRKGRELMDCPRALPSDSQNRLAEFSKKLRNERIPTSGGIEITRRCNLDCLHCYQRGDRKNKTAASEELSTETWKKIVDEIAEAGCLFLLFTGGEPFVRRDFPEIHAYAKASGLLTTVFTNGYHVPEEALAAFDEYPPDNVEISIYGASPETYTAATGRADGFEKCWKNVDMLVRAGVRVRVKTMLTTLNRDDFDAIERMTRERDLKISFRRPSLRGLRRRPVVPSIPGGARRSRGKEPGRPGAQGGLDGLLPKDQKRCAPGCHVRLRGGP